jgi:hypothetical protein
MAIVCTGSPGIDRMTRKVMVIEKRTVQMRTTILWTHCILVLLCDWRLLKIGCWVRHLCALVMQQTTSKLFSSLKAGSLQRNASPSSTTDSREQW